MRPHAANVVTWLKESLPRAHEDPELKKRIKLLLGAPRFAPNLAHLGLWTDLMDDCSQSMQKRYAVGVVVALCTCWHTVEFSHGKTMLCSPAPMLLP